MSNKILLHIAAGNGDLINTTGVIEALYKKRSDLEIDCLVLKRQAYLIKNTIGINKILHIEDFDIPDHVIKPDYDKQINKVFKDSYSKIINMWKTTKNDGDFPQSKIHILNANGLPISVTRKEIRGVLRPSQEDIAIVDEFISKNRIGGRVALIEDDSVTARFCGMVHIKQQIRHQPHINKLLKDYGWATISNNLDSTYSSKSLNLIHIKLLFDKCCKLFAGLSSGMTTALFTEPSNYNGKYFFIAGHKMWDYTKHFNAVEKVFFDKQYTVHTFKRELQKCKLLVA